MEPNKTPESAIYADLGARLEALRWVSGLSKTEIAAIAGVKRQNWNSYESGTRRRIQVGALARLALELGVDLNWLIIGPDRPPQKAPTAPAGSSLAM